MKTFREHTDRKRANVHLSHLEDLIFRPGGLATVHEIAGAFESIFSGSTTATIDISVKWDGAPAIVFGPDTDGKFFVSTKSAFNVTPKRAKSHEDIESMWTSEGLKRVLHIAFDVFSPLNLSIPVQGDVLFTQDTLHGDGGAVAFQPNTLRYVVTDPSLIEQCKRSRIGIALHTQYFFAFQDNWRGSGISASAFVEVAEARDAFVIDATLWEQDIVPFIDALEEGDFRLRHEHMLDASAAADDRVYDLFESNAAQTLLNRYVNDCVRSQSRPSGLDFISFLKDRHDSLYEQAYVMQDELYRFFVLHDWITLLKSVIINKLAESAHAACPIDAYVFVDGFWQKTVPEGFVVSVKDTTVKLVDRRVFSRLNFTSAKTWQG